MVQTNRIHVERKLTYSPISEINYITTRNEAQKSMEVVNHGAQHKVN